MAQTGAERVIRHLTAADLAERYGVSVQTVHYWRHIGTGPAVMKIGRHLRYRIEDVLAWEESRRHVPAQLAGNSGRA